MKPKTTWKICKTVFPQHSDHAGVLWHGTYFNWLEEARINALSKAGLNYINLTKKGFELPVIDLSIKYIKPLYLGDNITIESLFYIDKSPKIKIISQFISHNKKVITIAEVNLVLVNKDNFSIIRKRPDFISEAFLKLNE